MKVVALTLLTISLCSNQAFGACRPTGGPVGFSLIGDCPSPNLTESFSATWPDGYVEGFSRVTNGACGPTGVCCSPNGAEIKCEGRSDTPTTTSTGIFSVVFRSRGVTQGTNQNCQGGCSPVTVRTCYQVSTFTATMAHNCTRHDDDLDGYYAEEGDCVDTDPNINPGVSVSANCGGPAPEGSTDNNCNGIDDFTEACSPIVVDVLGNGFNLTNLASGVQFDLSSDGIKERLSWTAPNSDDAWLALDRNHDGRIGNGSELFGSFTLQPATPTPSGFFALAEYDRLENGGNGDGKIDTGDGIYSSLLLWQDVNHNGISESNELHRLASLGLRTIYLDYAEAKQRDQYGNWFRYRAKVKDAAGNHLGRWAYDVFLLH
jgi:hypothetical protein